jgi:multiple sugar transport system substrate-binding protein
VACLVLLTLIFGCRPSGNSGERRLTVALALFPVEAEHYREFLHDFESTKRVHVEIIAQSYSDILRAMRAEAAAGHGRLDVVELDLAMLGEAASSARPLDRAVTSSARSLFPDAAWKAALFGGRLDFVPHRLMWQAMIYNRKFVPTPPATWEELRTFARNHPGKFAIKGARYEGLICDAMPFVWAAGGSELAPESGGSMRALEFLSAISPDLNPESAVFREMSTLEAQARGEVWLHFNWPFAIGYLKGKGLAPDEDLSAPIPRGPDGTATPLGGGYLAIPRSAPHPQMALEFLRYLLTPETQRKLSAAMNWYGSAPPAAGTEDAKLYSGFTAMRPFIRPRAVVCDYTELSNRWQRAVRGVLFHDESVPSALIPVAAIAASSRKTPGACE